MQTSEFTPTHRPTHRKELSDGIFPNFVPDQHETTQHEPEIEANRKVRRKRTMSRSVVVKAPIMHFVQKPRICLLITGFLCVLILLLLYLTVFNETMYRRFFPRISTQLINRDWNQPQSSCVSFIGDNFNKINDEKLSGEQNLNLLLDRKNILHMLIVNNQFYVRRKDYSSGVHGMIYDFMSDLTSAFKIPDTRFALHLGDLNEESNEPEDNFGQVLFTMTNQPAENMITVPNITAINIWEAVEKNKLDRIKGRHLFHDRNKVALFRGTFSESTPLAESNIGKLLAFSLRFPQLVDAKLYSCETCTEQELKDLKEKRQLLDTPMNLVEQMSYRYHIVMSGQVSLRRLFSKSLIISTNSKVTQYNGKLTPYQEYIPLREDLSDLPRKLKWANDYSHTVKDIANRAEELATVLMGKECAIYNWKVSLEKYASHQKNVKNLLNDEEWTRVSPYIIYS
ncbi:protein O-glucosyltransferase [Acrasis kona]|uniref:Protein O-glucosyltransferase n=1 Tax=Acrasis kona TaxID=1008807 RepID=A0AAW2YU51_9EUKA